MKGYKTYTGLVIIFLGLIGANNIFLPEETANVADIIVQILGLAFAAYGRYEATK